MNWYSPRKIDTLVKECSKEYPVLLLIGTRGAGKGSIIGKAFPRFRQVSLELPTAASLASDNPSLFLSMHPSPLVIDSIEASPVLLDHIVSSCREKGRCRYVLVSKCLVEADSEYVKTLYIDPLSYAESSSRSLEAFLLNGGYPELKHFEFIARDRFFSSFLSSFLSIDIRNERKVSSLLAFERLIRELAAISSQTIDYAKLGRRIGASIPTVSSWVSILEKYRLISIVKPYPNSIARSVKSPRVYFNDTGLLVYLLGIESTEGMLGSAFLLQIFRTFVFSEIRKSIDIASSDCCVYFYSEHSGLSADFIIQGIGSGAIINAHWMERDDNDRSELDEVREKLSLDGFALCSVTRAEERKEADGITVIPADQISSILLGL